ncbi:hypothetical protein G7070_12585 [Propioniciclava coleopterorum]|uniref:Lipoprotein n=1 Tax=Propioniciclava coleopterorum TaxID=2714937 RepID=A0A6G7Y846_9ACTN|nr:hypothetical protein [Propioniciclava coleopterorum]QIK72950.1 hypothetical protein G7070_12585 [Propioniciclava coleopterorum]
MTTTPKHARGAGLLAAVIAAATLSGCVGGPAPAGPSDTPPPAPGTASATPTDSVAQESAKKAGIDLTELGDPIGSATIPAQGTDSAEDTLTVTLHQLKRVGPSVLGVYSFEVESSSTDAQTLRAYLGGLPWRPYLIDQVNLTKHAVLEGGTASARTDSDSVRFAPGQTHYAYAYFAGPPADVTAMDAIITEGAPPVTQVKLS